MKKSLILFLCLVMVTTAFLAGCSSTDEPEVAETQPAG
ncbi:outer membrane murein-binding lipoprotein Lpp, partial [Fusibacter tunisiensis]|nr:outer membrane murein-binding lipoprotein Lpp [Fusibacter tunisiensis]